MSKKSREDALAGELDKTTEESKGEMGMVPASNGPSGDLTTRAQSYAALSSKEQLRALEEEMGIDEAEVEVIASGTIPFWPAFAGATIIGTIVNYREVPTRFKTPVNPDGLVTLYTLHIEKPCLAGTLDGEIFEATPGDQIAVLERTVLKELRMRTGQKVGILCVGKRKSKTSTFSYWDYKIIGKRRSSAEIQAASQELMARTQLKALPQATPKAG